MGPRLIEVSKRRPDVAVRELDFNRPDFRGIDFDSPLATQYDIHSAPAFIIYGPDGKMVSNGDVARAQVVQAIRSVEE